MATVVERSRTSDLLPGSVVVRDVEDYAVVVGNPAKTVRSRR